MNQDQYKTSQELKCYITTKERIYELEQEIKELESQITGLSAQKLDGMPKAPGFSRSDRVEKILDKLDQIEDEIVRELEELKDKRDKINGIIKKVKKPTLRRLLEMRYLESGEDSRPHSWEYICCKMGYSWRQIHRLHKEALDAVKEIKDGTHWHT
ncbi:MAG: hypothetical protein ACI39G_02105 [Pseudoramibacter sp.]